MEASDILPERAEAAMIRSQATWSLQRPDEARAALREAAEHLAACDEDRFIAQLWFDLGALFEQVGLVDDGSRALRMAAAASGLTSGRSLHDRTPAAGTSARV